MNRLYRLACVLFAAALLAGCSMNNSAVKKESEQPAATASSTNESGRSAERSSTQAEAGSQTEQKTAQSSETPAKQSPSMEEKPQRTASMDHEQSKPETTKKAPAPKPETHHEAAKAHATPERHHETAKAQPKPEKHHEAAKAAHKPEPKQKPTQVASAKKPKTEQSDSYVTSQVPAEIRKFLRADERAVKSQDVDRIMSRYSEDFESDGRDYNAQEAIFAMYGGKLSERWDVKIEKLKVEPDAVTILKGQGITTYGAADMAGTKIIKKDGHWMWLGNGK